MSEAVAEIKRGQSYLDDVKAQAYELMSEGQSAEATARALDVHPRTVQRWAARWRALDGTEGPLLMDNWTRIVLRAQQKMHDFMDYLEENPDQIVKHALIPNVYAGTGTDKLLKANEKPSISAQQVTINFIVESKPEPIDVEYEVKE